MRPTFAQTNFAIFDDFLPERDWIDVWAFFQRAALKPVAPSIGAWRVQDGQPLASERMAWLREDPRCLPEQPDAPAPVGGFVRQLSAVRPALDPWIGGGLAMASGHAYVYPAGTSLRWHLDGDGRTGAFIYYAHPRWNIEWGGELLIADLDADKVPASYRFDNEDLNEFVLGQGRGHFVMPRPNRLVVTGNAPHAVRPISPCAGSNVRASLQGFFMREADVLSAQTGTESSRLSGS